MRTTIGFFIIALLSINQSYGQAIGSVWGEVGIPSGEFRRNTDAFGLGLGLGAYASVDPSGMVFLGLDASYEIYGKNIESDGFYELVTNNNMLQLHAVLRIMPQSTGVKPFVEGLFGFKYLYTVDKVKEDIISSALETRVAFHDIALSYGGSFGLRFPFNSEDSGGAIEFRIQYLLGGGAEYIDARSIRDFGFDSAINNPISSETDMVVFKIGYSTYF